MTRKLLAVGLLIAFVVLVALWYVAGLSDYRLLSPEEVMSHN